MIAKSLKSHDKILFGPMGALGGEAKAEGGTRKWDRGAKAEVGPGVVRYSETMPWLKMRKCKV